MKVRTNDLERRSIWVAEILKASTASPLFPESTRKRGHRLMSASGQ
jgi:hypothetical protein